MPDQLNQYINELILAVVSILAILAKIWLKELKVKATTYFEQRTTAGQRKLLILLGQEAFCFAEAAYKELQGPQKMEKAIGYLENRIKALGLTITPEELRAVIEKAWLDNEKPSK